MRVREDGSIQSSAVPTYQNVGRDLDFGLYRGLVTKVIYSDDPANLTTNSTNPQVLYDVVVLGGFSAGQIISNCRLSDRLGGLYNYSERTLRAASADVSKVKLADQDGDVVYVQFVQGHTGFPVIVGLDNGIKPQNPGAKLEEGPVDRQEFNGIKTEVNKLGEFTFKRRGGKYDAQAKTFTPTNTGTEVEAKVYDRDVELNLGEDVIKTKLSGTDEAITIEFKSGLKIAIDAKGDVAKIEMKGGAKATVDGKADVITLETVGGAKAEIDGGSDKITLTASELLSDNASEFTTTAPIVNLGSASPAEKAAVASKVEARLQALELALATHILVYNTHVVIPVNNAVADAPFVAIPTPTGSNTVKIEP